jgi:hypothetical protein
VAEKPRRYGVIREQSLKTQTFTVTQNSTCGCSCEFPEIDRDRLIATKVEILSRAGVCNVVSTAMQAVAGDRWIEDALESEIQR